MSGAILSPKDRAQLLQMMRRQTLSTVHRRMNTLLLLDDGWTAERVAEALFIDAETVREHRRLYQKAGVAGVLELKYEGSEPALNEEQLAELGQELDRRLYLTAKEVADFVRRRFGVNYTPHAMAKLLNRIGFVYKMPKCVPAKADPAAQQRFVEDTLAPLMAAANADNPLYFVDATHPSYTAHPGQGWIRKGETRIKLVYLPAYAPNLNLIERFWWLFKKKTLYNEHFPTFAEFKAAVDKFFANLASYRGEINSLITGAFHYIGAQNPQAP